MSNELQCISVTLFHEAGTLKRDRWPMLSPQAVHAASWGGFLTIEVVKVDEAHRGKDLGYECVHFTLNCLRGRWNLSVVDLCYFGGIQEKKHQIYELFTRVGYRQNVQRRRDYWYLTPENVRQDMTKESARGTVFDVLPEEAWYKMDEEKDKIFDELSSPDLLRKSQSLFREREMDYGLEIEKLQTKIRFLILVI